MKKRGSLLVISILCALATTYLIYELLQQRVREANPEEETRPIVVAQSKIPPYTKITPAMVKIVQTHWKSVHPQSATSVDQVVGKVSLQTFIPNEPVMKPKVAEPGSSNLFAMQIPDGKRAMSIPLTKVKGVGGHIKPGDTVDILVAYEKEMTKQQENIVKLTLQNIQVLAVGDVKDTPIEDYDESADVQSETNQNEKASEDQQSGSTITLSVSPQQAESLGFAESYGEVRLLLRAPQDKKNVKTPGIQNHSALSQ